MMEPISPRVIPLEKVLNARELGGLPLSNGREVRHGALIRTGRLCEMSADDRYVLTHRWKVTDIVDLRNEQETAEHPDPVLEGAVYHPIAIFPGMAEGISREDNGRATFEERVLQLAQKYRGGRASKLFKEMYPRMVQEECCIGGIRQFFQILLDHGDGALLWHCTSGKDRTGLTGALLLYVLGASWETILEEYLLTNEQIRSYRESVCEILRRHNTEEEAIRQIMVLESVEAGYLESCWDTMTKMYGSPDAFLKEKLLLDTDAQEYLREKYTCPKQ